MYQRHDDANMNNETPVQLITTRPPNGWWR
jgi:hypothetical protein